MSNSETVRLNDIAGVVQEIHAAPGKIVIVVTGAGTLSLAWLFAEPGTSRTVLDARVPYSKAALNKFTREIPEQHVSPSEAVLMAQRALDEAIRLCDESPAPLLAGVSCTAAIATDRERRGENRCHIAFAVSDGRSAVTSLVMSKGARDRSGEEDVVSRIVLNAVAEAKRVETRVAVSLIDDESLKRSEEIGVATG